MINRLLSGSPDADQRLARRTVLITGGSGDLGHAMAEEFRKSFEIVLAPSRSQLDVAKIQSIKEFFRQIQSLDVLVANAGLTRDRTMVSLTDADFSAVLDVNLRGTFLCVRETLRAMMQRQSGHIILIGSRAAKCGTHGQSAYAASKAALVAFGQSIAREYGSRNIRCNIVLPGFLETKFTKQLSQERKEYIRREHVLQRFNTVQNAARFIAFLAEVDHVSGQIFTLDSRIDSWT